MSPLSAMANGSSSVTSDTDTDPELDLHSLSNRVKILEQNNVSAVLFESYLRSRWLTNRRGDSSDTYTHLLPYAHFWPRWYHLSHSRDCSAPLSICVWTSKLKQVCSWRVKELEWDNTIWVCLLPCGVRIRELERPERSLLLQLASDSHLRSIQHSQRLDQTLCMLKEEIGVMVSVCADLEVLTSTNVS